MPAKFIREVIAFAILILDCGLAKADSVKMLFEDLEVRGAYDLLWEEYMGLPLISSGGDSIFLGYCGSDIIAEGDEELLFPDLSPNRAEFVLGNLDQLAQLESQLAKAGFEHEAIFQAVGSGVDFEFDGDEMLAKFYVGQEAIYVDKYSAGVALQTAVHYFLSGWGSGHGKNLPTTSTADSCGGGITLRVVTSPPGARVWWTTDFRIAACNSPSQNRCDPWKEITGVEEIGIRGDRIFKANWPDGRSAIYPISANGIRPDSVVDLRPDQ